MMRRLIGLDSLRTFRASVARTVAVATVIVAIALLIALSLNPASDRSVAAGPKNVRGTVYDSIGNPVAGANVTVKIIRGGSTITTLWYDSTESNGFYTVTFGFGDWYDLDTIEVTAKYDLDEATNSTVADSGPLQTVDVHIGSLIIPEFGGLLQAPVVVVSVSSTALILVLRRRFIEQR